MSSAPEKSTFTEACRQQFSFSSEDQFDHAISVLGLMVIIVLFDHEIIAMEREFLKRYLVQTFSISEEDSKKFIDSLADGSLHVSIAEREHFQKYLKENCDRKEKNAHLRLFFEVAAAERHITEQSCVVISRITRGIGLTLSEYELARLPYLHIIISQESGVLDERSFERKEYAYPVELEFQKKRWIQILANQPTTIEIELNNISLSGFSCLLASSVPEHTPVILILNHYFRLNANVIRSQKNGNRWEISAEFDLDYAQFLHLKCLLDIENYYLEKYLNEEQLRYLALIPLHILVYFREIPHSSQKLTSSTLSQSLEKAKGLSVPLIHPLITRALENQEILEQIEQNTFEKDFQVFNQGAALLEEMYPETIAIIVKEKFCEWIVSTLAKRQVFWRRPSLDLQGRKVLENVAKELNFDLSQWKFPY